MTGYGNGLFGSNDPVTREQIATILWRYQGSPAPAGTAANFTDQSTISSYAVNAVAWARENGIINGMESNRFAPKNNATRAQVATILRNYLQNETPAPEPTPDANAKVLVAYFSATGNTENIAQHLETVLDADLYEIVPQQPYTSADLNYGSSNSRAEQEINDPNARPAISGSVSNMDDYDVVFIGYPIWWGGRHRKSFILSLKAMTSPGKPLSRSALRQAAGLVAASAGFRLWPRTQIG